MSLRFAVLGLVAELDGSSGYDLQKVFKLSLNHVWHATQSQLYGELGKLAAEGFVEVVGEGARGRKAYAVTPEGRAALHHWLTATEPRRAHREEVLLRVFFLDQISREDALDYLTRQREAALRDLAELTDLEEALGRDMSFFGRVVLEHGLRIYAMTAEWCDWAEQGLRAREG